MSIKKFLKNKTFGFPNWVIAGMVILIPHCTNLANEISKSEWKPAPVIESVPEPLTKLTKTNVIVLCQRLATNRVYNPSSAVHNVGKPVFNKDTGKWRYNASVNTLPASRKGTKLYNYQCTVDDETNEAEINI